MIVRTSRQMPLLLKLSLWTRLRIAMGGRLFVVFEARYGIYDPKLIDASTRATVIPFWRKTPERLKNMEHTL